MKAIGASPGFAIGPVKIMSPFTEPRKEKVEDVKAALAHLDQVIQVADKQIKALRDKAILEMSESEGEVFTAHLLMLHDPELMGQVRQKIEHDHLTPAYSVLEVRNQYIAIFESMDNAYMRERKADVKDVCNRLIRGLTGQDDQALTSEAPVILVAHDLTPSDTAGIKKGTVAGFITEIGGKTSHSAIMARSLEIPAIVGAGQVLDDLKEGQVLALNGLTGEWLINPSQEDQDRFLEAKRVYEADKESLKAFMGQPSKTLDGHYVELACNIGQPDEVDNVLKNDGEGIGLFRSEFLYMDRTSMPSEEEQFAAYKKVVEGMSGKQVVIRTLDVGGDKQIPYLDFPKEENPFLGYRAIRYCLDHDLVFKSQLRALLRASAYGRLGIMFPMISNMGEIRQAKRVLKEVEKDLLEAGFEVGSYQVGIMIEVPSAALIADQLAKEVDFFSIGTNDLIQYTCAVDRMNQNLNHLYSPYHPGLLRLIKMVIDAGKKEGIWVGMCGEVAGNETLIPFLLALGLEEFSMSPSSILRVRRLIASLNYDSLRHEVEAVLNAEDSDQVLNILKKTFSPK